MKNKADACWAHTKGNEMPAFAPFGGWGEMICQRELRVLIYHFENRKEGTEVCPFVQKARTW